MIKKYKLQGHMVIEHDGSFLEWARWFETVDRQVAIDKIDMITVSTVFLGIDHNFGLGNGDPILFEILVFWQMVTLEKCAAILLGAKQRPGIGKLSK